VKSASPGMPNFFGMAPVARMTTRASISRPPTVRMKPSGPALDGFDRREVVELGARVLGLLGHEVAEVGSRSRRRGSRGSSRPRRPDTNLAAREAVSNTVGLHPGAGP